MSKLLTQVLLEMDEETVVYIGSKSSFFDIETAGRLRGKEYMRDLSNALEKEAKEQVDSARREFDRALRNPPKWLGGEDEKKEKSIAEYIDLISRWPQKLQSLQKRVATTEMQIRKRRVKDIYPRIDGTGICVIVEGSECGSYWFAEEKKKKKKKKEAYE